MKRLGLKVFCCFSTFMDNQRKYKKNLFCKRQRKFEQKMFDFIVLFSLNNKSTDNYITERYLFNNRGDATL